jgi:predicted nucleotide-binding protein (sugar kinase/HSP70/actin superfamily)
MPDSKNRKVKIHVDGEVYLRVAQIEEILKFLIDTIGYGSFDLSYTPLWCYFEYILESRITFANRDINMYKNKLKYIDEINEKNRLVNLIKEKKCFIRKTTKTINNLRNVLAKPLYKVSGLEIPHRMSKIIAEAKPVLPTYKPCGELVPYVGETISQLNEGADLVLNVAPEGCMVSSLGAILTPKIKQSVKNDKALIQHLFSTEGELNEDLLRLSLLKIFGSEKYYSN